MIIIKYYMIIDNQYYEDNHNNYKNVQHQDYYHRQ